MRETAGARHKHSAGANRRVRRYGFACSACKARKARCSGEQPVCAGCSRSGDECIWPSSKSAENRLRDAQARIRQLEASLKTSSSAGDADDDGVPVAESPVGDDDQIAYMPSQRSAEASKGGPGTPSQSHLATCPTQSSGVSPASITTNATTTNPDTSSSLWFQVGLGEDGTVIYNGPTSRFHAGSLAHDGNAAESDPEPTREHMAILMSQYPLMDSVWAPLIAAKSRFDGTGVDTKTGIALLDIYWSWLHPLHSVVYRPLMLMDLALGGPHCSDFLLLCIFALAARHLPKNNPEYRDVVEQGDEFVALAKASLLKEMSAHRPAIPTIQGLLILGGRQCAMGKSSEGWLYTGMALRMITDIGLHLDIVGLARLERWTPAEIEARKRLYNSAYIWDKTLSLALGRSPSLTRRPYSSSEILDKYDDERLWLPVHADEVVESFSPLPSWNSSTFCAFCGLHEITTDMMLLFSSSTGTENFTAQIDDLEARFLQWYSDIPPSLKIDDSAQLDQSPPPHIVSLNLLYRTLRILVRRPFLNAESQRTRDEHMNHCAVQAREIHAIYTLFTKTFPHRLITYQVSYCIYTAAIIEASELRRASDPRVREGAAARLAAAVTVLQKEASHTPGSGRSLDTIRRLLGAGPTQRQRLPHDRLAVVTRSMQVEREPIAHNMRLVDSEQDQGSSDAILEPLPEVEGYAGVSQRTRFSGISRDPTAQESAPRSSIAPQLMGRLLEDDFGFGSTDTGAGFQPDAFSWWTPEIIPRMPVLPMGGEHGWPFHPSQGGPT